MAHIISHSSRGPFSGTIRDLVATTEKREQFVFADHTTSLDEACAMLKKHHISSLPIFDGNKNEYVGLVDITDICLLVVFSYAQKLKEGKLQEFNFKDVKVADLLPLSEEGKLAWSFDPEENVEDTMEAFSKGVHRAVVPIYEGNELVYHIVSQRDAVEFMLDQHLHDDIFKSKIYELPKLFENKPELVAIDGETLAIDAFKKIGREHFGAVPVVDDKGQIYASLCASDLSGTDLTQLHTLLLTTNVFLKCVHNNNIPKPLTASTSDTLGEVAKNILGHNDHRAWVIDTQGKLSGVITLSDICKVFVKL